jgi:hypothetical protein
MDQFLSNIFLLKALQSQIGRKIIESRILVHSGLDQCSGNISNKMSLLDMYFRPHQCTHRVHVFTRDETGSVYLPNQLERTLQLYW